jgi:hypothetical protein
LLGSSQNGYGVVASFRHEARYSSSERTVEVWGWDRVGSVSISDYRDATFVFQAHRVPNSAMRLKGIPKNHQMMGILDGLRALDGELEFSMKSKQLKQSKS